MSLKNGFEVNKENEADTRFNQLENKKQKQKQSKQKTNKQTHTHTHTHPSKKKKKNTQTHTQSPPQTKQNKELKFLIYQLISSL